MITNPDVAYDVWEGMWAPYDALTYAAVLDHIAYDDIVLEIGAGDCRLARTIAQHAHKVYAIEQNTKILEKSRKDLPLNCHVIAGDARFISFPHDVTAAVLLMRHCTQFSRYWSKLKNIGCQVLITNARWGMGVELINLHEPRILFDTLLVGWYACCCGKIGFIPNEDEKITDDVIDKIWEVKECPVCSG